MQATFDKDAKAVQVTLSRRNLESLIKMLDDRDKWQPALERLTEDNITISVLAQEDSEHYDGRAIGPMSWETV